MKHPGSNCSVDGVKTEHNVSGESGRFGRSCNVLLRLLEVKPADSPPFRDNRPFQMCLKRPDSAEHIYIYTMLQLQLLYRITDITTEQHHSIDWNGPFEI